MHFFPIHHFDQIDTKMDLFLMKFLLITSPGTLQQSRVGEPGAGGSFEGKGSTLTLGWWSPQQRVLGSCPWDTAMGRSWGSRHPDHSSWCSRLSVPATPSPPTPARWFPFQRLMPIPAELASSPLQVQFYCAARLVNESVGPGAVACHLLEVGFPSLSFRVLIVVTGTLPEPAPWGIVKTRGHDDVQCLVHSGHLTNSGRGSCQALFPTRPAHSQTHWERRDPFP